MFNRKKIAQLEAELKEANNQKGLFIKIAGYLHNLMNEKETISSRLNRIDQKVDPKPVPKYDQSAVDLAKKLQGFTKTRKCGAGGCGYVYSIPAHVIDEVAMIKHIDRQ